MAEECGDDSDFVIVKKASYMGQAPGTKQSTGLSAEGQETQAWLQQVTQQQVQTDEETKHNSPLRSPIRKPSRSPPPRDGKPEQQSRIGPEGHNAGQNEGIEQPAEFSP